MRYAYAYTNVLNDTTLQVRRISRHGDVLKTWEVGGEFGGFSPGDDW